MISINEYFQPISTFEMSSKQLSWLSWLLWILFFAMILVSIITLSIQKSFKEKNQKYALSQSSTQKTGSQIAKEILNKNGINNIRIVQGIEGQDFFNPQTREISLSPSVFNSSSVSAMAIAAHECGHAIQWQKKSIMLRIRVVLTKPVQIATNFGQAIFSLGLFFFLFFTSAWLLWTSIAGIVMYFAMGIFQLITLPIEFDASRRAKKQLKEMSCLNSENDIKGTKSVLNAAAMTYVIAFIGTIITLAFFIIRFILLTRNK